MAELLGMHIENHPTPLRIGTNEANRVVALAA